MEAFERAWSLLKGWPYTSPYLYAPKEGEEGEADTATVLGRIFEPNFGRQPRPRADRVNIVGRGRTMVPQGSPQAKLLQSRKNAYGLFSPDKSEEMALESLRRDIGRGSVTAFNPNAQPTHEDFDGPFTQAFDYSAQEAEREAERERKEQEALAASQVPDQAAIDYWAARGKSWDSDMGRWV